jgi:hypothetical protein
MERYMNKFVILSDSHHVTCHIYEPTDTDTIHNTDTTLDKGAIDILGPYGILYTFWRLAERISQYKNVNLIS